MSRSSTPTGNYDDVQLGDLMKYLVHDKQERKIEAKINAERMERIDARVGDPKEKLSVVSQKLILIRKTAIEAKNIALEAKKDARIARYEATDERNTANLDNLTHCANQGKKILHRRKRKSLRSRKRSQRYLISSQK